MSTILQDNDEALQLDIFSYHEDFNENVDVWQRKLLPWDMAKNTVCSCDIETTGLDNTAIDACIISIQARLNGIDYLWDVGHFENVVEFWGNYEQPEKRMLVAFISWLESPETNIYILTGHYFFDFDLPYIMKRCEYHGIHCGFKYKESWNNKLTEVKNSSRYGKTISFLNIVHCKFNIVDTLQLCAIADKMQSKLSSFGLKSVCGPNGYDLRGERQEIPGDQIFITYITDRAKFNRYLMDDINDTELLLNYLLPSLYYLLVYIPGINLQNLIFSGNGQKWSKILETHYGYRPETDYKTVYPGGFTGIKSGFYSNVAKLDVASLYPSIMLSQRVCSKKDIDMYQLKVLSLIKRERLRLKELGKQGNKDAKFQENSLKILINSGYGALGTIGICFNDMSAAAEVTAYGRAILDFMIQYCKSKGAKIVQADTDGIILSHPDLDGLHNDLQDSLPDWVDVEQEAKYDYVWIYKRKNYITYKNDVPSAIGIARKRDKPELMKRYLKYVPTLYSKNGMDAVKLFTDNVVAQITNRNIDIKLLCKTEKVKEYKDKSTTNNLANDLNAQPGEQVTYYIKDAIIEYYTEKKHIKKTKNVFKCEHVSNYDNDYSVEYYTNEITKCKFSKKKNEFTQEGWYYMFYNSINHPINSTSSGKLL